MDLTLIRTLHGVSAGDDFAKDYLRRWPIGEARRANVRRPRALKSLRRYWALVNLVYQNSEQFKSTDSVHAFLKIKAGHCTPIVAKSSGEVFLIPDSISFDTLDEQAFNDVWNRVVQVVSEDILGTGVPEIEAEIERIVGFRRG
jgi:hypothetical protein